MLADYGHPKNAGHSWNYYMVTLKLLVILNLIQFALTGYLAGDYHAYASFETFV